MDTGYVCFTGVLVWSPTPGGIRCVYFIYCNVLVVNTNKLCRLVVYLHKLIDPKAYSLKVRLLRLPDHFGRKLLIKLVDGELPGRSIST